MPCTDFKITFYINRQQHLSFVQHDHIHVRTRKKQDEANKGENI